MPSATRARHRQAAADLSVLGAARALEDNGGRQGDGTGVLHTTTLPAVRMTAAVPSLRILTYELRPLNVFVDHTGTPAAV